jgi:hypothetical protein
LRKIVRQLEQMPCAENRSGAADLASGASPELSLTAKLIRPSTASLIWLRFQVIPARWASCLVRRTDGQNARQIDARMPPNIRRKRSAG